MAFGYGYSTYPSTGVNPGIPGNGPAGNNVGAPVVSPSGYGYGGYPGPGGYYAPPMPDNLASLRQNGQQTAQPPVPLVTQPQGQPASMSGPVFVNGEAGAKGYLVAAGNTVMLIDADPDANTFWLKSADASGMPSMRTFDYVERTTATKQPQTPVEAPVNPNVEYVQRADFNALAARCEEIAAELTALKSNPCKCANSKKQKEEVNDGESV